MSIFAIIMFILMGLFVAGWIVEEVAYSIKKHKSIEFEKQTEVETIQNRTQSIHIVGVRFENQTSGCYYYIGDNNYYQIYDKVEVPTKYGVKVATIVFKKMYKENEKLPYPYFLLERVRNKIPSNYVNLYSKVDRNRKNNFDDIEDDGDIYYEANSMSDGLISEGYHFDDDGNWEPDDVYDDID